jgi:hypothetical protein
VGSKLLRNGQSVICPDLYRSGAQGISRFKALAGGQSLGMFDLLKTGTMQSIEKQPFLSPIPRNYLRQKHPSCGNHHYLTMLFDGGSHDHYLKKISIIGSY